MCPPLSKPQPPNTDPASTPASVLLVADPICTCSLSLACCLLPPTHPPTETQAEFENCEFVTNTAMNGAGAVSLQVRACVRACVCACVRPVVCLPCPFVCLPCVGACPACLPACLPGYLPRLSCLSCELALIPWLPMPSLLSRPAPSPTLPAHLPTHCTPHGVYLARSPASSHFVLCRMAPLASSTKCSSSRTRQVSTSAPSAPDPPSCRAPAAGQPACRGVLCCTAPAPSPVNPNLPGPPLLALPQLAHPIPSHPPSHPCPPGLPCSLRCGRRHLPHLKCWFHRHVVPSKRRPQRGGSGRGPVLLRHLLQWLHLQRGCCLPGAACLLGAGAFRWVLGRWPGLWPGL